MYFKQKMSLLRLFKFSNDLTVIPHPTPLNWLNPEPLNNTKTTIAFIAYSEHPDGTIYVTGVTEESISTSEQAQ